MIKAASVGGLQARLFSFARPNKAETVAFGYRARALVLNSEAITTNDRRMVKRRQRQSAIDMIMRLTLTFILQERSHRRRLSE